MAFMAPGTHIGFAALVALWSMAAHASTEAGEALDQSSPVISGGSGCPSGTSVIHSTGDYRVQYRVSAQNSGLSRKACTLAVPVTVPAGYQMALGKIDYSLDHDLPNPGSRARSSIEIFTSGTSSAPDTQSIAGPSRKTIKYKVPASRIGWTECSATETKQNLRMNSSLQIQASQSGELADATLSIRAQTRIRKCQK
jgi:hypothetical protein